MYTREISGTQKTFLYIDDSSVAIKEQNPTTVTKASASVTTTANVWYDYHLVTEGSRMEVWRGPQGGPLELVLETDALTNFETDSMMLLSLNGAQGKFDNVQFISHDPKTTTFAYNDANELTTMTEGGTTTTYTYDDWGRTISKSDGTHSATYGWRFGDKLNSAPARCQVALGNALASKFIRLWWIELRDSKARMLSKAREEGSATAKTTAFPSTTWERATTPDWLIPPRLYAV